MNSVPKKSSAALKWLGIGCVFTLLICCCVTCGLVFAAISSNKGSDQGITRITQGQVVEIKTGFQNKALTNVVSLNDTEYAVEFTEEEFLAALAESAGGFDTSTLGVSMEPNNIKIEFTLDLAGLKIYPAAQAQISPDGKSFVVSSFTTGNGATDLVLNAAAPNLKRELEQAFNQGFSEGTNSGIKKISILQDKMIINFDVKSLNSLPI